MKAITWRRSRRTYYVYIMSSISRTLYTGVTNNLERRIGEHRERRPGSFTARYNIDRRVYFEEFDDINQAIARESEIKQMARRTKIMLIESTNSDWRDLSAEWAGIPHARQPRARE
jgi:putative endonuclease